MGDRSRSPSGRSDWISKQVVFFGRYENKRPSGLYVDSSGAFTLSSLMQCWGDSQGISKEDVLRAIKQNMWSNAGAQRFELEESGGDHLIRATGKKAAGGSNSWSSNGGGGGGGQASWSASGASSWSQPAATKEKASWESNSSWNESGNSWEKDNGGGKSWDAKSWEKDSGGAQSWEKEDNSWDKGADKDKWGKSSSSTSWGGSKSWNDQSNDTPDAEKVQRWIGWALKAGAHDLGLYVQSGGWASIDDLAKELAARKPDFGIADGDALTSLIRSSDSEGRFEVDEHRRLRKVARDQRQHGQHQQSNHWEQQPQHAQHSQQQQQQQQQQQDQWQQPWQQQQQQSAHKVLQQQPKASGPSGSAWGSAAPGGYVRPDSGARGGGGEAHGPTAPSLPPGPGWTEYVDCDVYWWYYEGPLGKWWLSERDEAPMPWTEG